MMVNCINVELLNTDASDDPREFIHLQIYLFDVFQDSLRGMESQWTQDEMEGVGPAGTLPLPPSPSM
jgi:hypothetical protein